MNCWKQVLKDAYDGMIDRGYLVGCYRIAIRHLPEDGTAPLRALLERGVSQAAGPLVSPERDWASNSVVRICRTADVSLSVGGLGSEKTGQNTGTVILRNDSHSSCRLIGYPRLAFLDSHRHVLAFRFGYRGDSMITSRAPRVISVAAGGVAFFAFNKHRCDIRTTAVAKFMRVRLPEDRRFILLMLARYPVLGYCGTPSATPSIAVSPFVARVNEARQTR
jgi:hypothetical protein